MSKRLMSEFDDTGMFGDEDHFFKHSLHVHVHEGERTFGMFPIIKVIAIVSRAEYIK